MLEVFATKQLDGQSLDFQLSCDGMGITTIFGKSGAGKTSLINMIAGLLRPDQGSIRLNGTTLFDSQKRINVAPEKRRIGYVFQDARLFPHLTVGQNLLYGFNNTPEEERKIRFDDVVDLLCISSLIERRTHRLSGGEKQRVAIGRALLSSPRLMLMDEPLSALDTAHKEEILPFIERLRDHFTIPVIYVSHSMEENIRLADTMVLLDRGRVIAVDSVSEITGRLDLAPHTGRFEAGSVLEAKVMTANNGHGLSVLGFSGGELRVPPVNAPAGSAIRVRIRARDIALALERPQGSSFQNILPAQILDVGTDDETFRDLMLLCGEARLWARITRNSFEQMQLNKGKTVYMLIKSVSVSRRQLGHIIRKPD